MYKVSRLYYTITETWYFVYLHAYKVSHRRDLALPVNSFRMQRKGEYRDIVEFGLWQFFDKLLIREAAHLNF